MKRVSQITRMKMIPMGLALAVLLFTLTACGDGATNSVDSEGSRAMGVTSESESASESLEAPEAESSQSPESEPEEATENSEEEYTQEITFCPETSTTEPVPPAQTSSVEEGVASMRIRLAFDGSEVIVNLYDTAPARELLSRLPLTLEFEDYAGAEKIAYLDQKLPGESGSETPSSGDFAYYSPWGNLAAFYNETASAGGGLIILGSIDSGKELLAGMTENFTVNIEPVA